MIRTSRMIPLVLALGLGLAAARSAAALDRTLSPYSQRLSDGVIARDLATLDGWKAHLDSLSAASHDPWRAAAAGAWLESARAEYTDNDRTEYPQAALTRAVELIQSIEAGAEPITHLTVPPADPPHGSKRTADSLYVTLDRLEHDPEFLCGAAELAQMEVQLSWAGNELFDQGPCQVSPHLERAADLGLEAERKILACQAPKPVAAPEMPKPAPVPVPQVIIPTVEELQIAKNVHFALGSWDISETSRRVIAGIAAVLTKYPSVTVRLEGHTDSRGSVELNMELSRKRVVAVEDVFIGMGIDSSRMAVTYKGKSELFATEDSKRGYALNRRVEMVFVDSEGRDIKASRQEGDIQLEADRKPKPVAPAGTRRHTTTGAAKAPGARPAAKPAPAKPAPKASPASRDSASGH